MLRKNISESECIIFMANSRFELPAEDVQSEIDHKLEYPTKIVFLPDSKKWNWYCRFPFVFKHFGMPKLKPVIRMMQELHEPKVAFVVHKKCVMQSSCAIASSLIAQGIAGPSSLRILLVNGICNNMEVADQCRKYTIPSDIVCDTKIDKKNPYKEIERLFMHD
jgi:hypothetical protein